MAKLIQAEPGQTFNIKGTSYVADELGVVKVRDKHAHIVMQFGLKEIKHVEDQKRAPGKTDDKTKGFVKGSLWHSVVGFFRCVANFAGEAAWDVVQQDQAYIPDDPEEAPKPQAPTPQPVISILGVDPANEQAAAAALKSQASAPAVSFQE